MTVTTLRIHGWMKHSNRCVPGARPDTMKRGSTRRHARSGDDPAGPKAFGISRARARQSESAVDEIEAPRPERSQPP